MLYLTHLSIRSFVPLPGGGSAGASAELVEPGEGEETLRAQDAMERQQLVRAKYFAACYLALRTYYGDHALPPLEAMHAYTQGDETSVYTWYAWVEQVLKASTATLFGPGDEFGQFVTVQNPHGSCDLLIFNGRLEIFFRLQAGQREDDSWAREKLFQPLLAFFEEASLSIDQLEAVVTYVDERGLHCAPLTTLLRELDLLARQ